MKRKVKPAPKPKRRIILEEHVQSLLPAPGISQEEHIFYGPGLGRALMARRQEAEQVFDLKDRYLYEIAPVCLAITAHWSGSGDPLPPARLAFLEAWLDWRLKTWATGIHEFFAVDLAFKNLIEATLCLSAYKHTPGKRAKRKR